MRLPVTPNIDSNCNSHPKKCYFSGFFKITLCALTFHQTCDFQSNATYPDSYQKPHQIQLIRQTASLTVYVCQRERERESERRCDKKGKKRGKKETRQAKLFSALVLLHRLSLSLSLSFSPSLTLRHTHTRTQHIHTQNTKQKWTKTQGFSCRGWLWLRALTAMTQVTSPHLLAADR